MLYSNASANIVEKASQDMSRENIHDPIYAYIYYVNESSSRVPRKVEAESSYLGLFPGLMPTSY